MSLARDQEATPADDDATQRAAQFARLVALESECARLRAVLCVGHRAAAKEALSSNAAWALIEGHASDFLSVHAADGTYIFASQSAERLFGHTPESLVGRSAYDYFHPDDLARIAKNHEDHLDPAKTPTIEYRLRRADGSYVWVETRSGASRAEGGVEEIVCITRDVTERRTASEAQRLLIVELERRAEQVRQLSGLLPICAWCKSIRDDAGYWHQVEAYFHRSADLEFTHGACPGCAAALRKGLEGKASP